MKFTVARDVLAEAVSWTARALPVRPASPILAGVRIKAEGDELTLSSFDYEVSANSHIPATVDEAGEVRGYLTIPMALAAHLFVRDE